MRTSYWVLPGELAAGPYPGAVDGTRAKRALRRLLEVGVRAFVDLTEPGEPTWRGPLVPYEDVLRKLGASLEHAVHYERFPVPDRDAPDPARMKAILDRLDAHRREGRPAYVHCLAGKGRTGTVVGCYLVRHAGELLGAAERPGAAALDAVVRLRREQGVPDPWDSPQTKPQVRRVLTWRPGR